MALGQRLMQQARKGVPFLLAAGVLGLASGPVWAEISTDKDVLRVCAPPSNLPFSNEAGEGFENKIAELFAEDLGVPLEYAYYPMQMGFGRNTLAKFLPQENRYRCDLVMGTTSLEVGQTTEPYYHSTFTLVYRNDAGLGDVQSLEDILEIPKERREELKIGVFAKSPPAQFLVENDLFQYAKSYKHQSGSRETSPGAILKRDLGNGDLDMILVWGPIGGYYAQLLQECQECKHNDLEVVELASGEKPSGRYHFGISMGVRHGEDQWFETVKTLIDKHQDEIDRLLREYNVPLVDEDGNVIYAAQD